MTFIELPLLAVFVLSGLGASRVLRVPSSNIVVRPNILWILADDLGYEKAELDIMPNLHRMKRESLEFVNHVSQSPLCGPARASMLVGRFPHNNGYKSQKRLTPQFLNLHDNSVGKWLTDSGYYTAFLGKYVNGMSAHFHGTKRSKRDVPTGWRHFGGFTNVWDPYRHRSLGGSYNYYNTSQWDLDFDETGLELVQKENSGYPILIWTGVHQADFLATQTVEQAQKAVEEGKPFFIFTNPVMVHWGTCEGPFHKKSRYKYDDPYWEQFLNVSSPSISPCAKKGRSIEYLRSNFGNWMLHTPNSNFGKAIIGKPDGVGGGSVDSWHDRLMIGRQNRTLSMVDLDEMVGSILHGLQRLQVFQNTYVIFTSDNGVHLGEHGLVFGKKLPYEHDIRVPLLVRTPHGASGVRMLPTTHLDLTRTIVDLAGATGAVTPSLDALDGKSFADALTNELKVGDWRRFSYSEMFESFHSYTWRNIRFVGEDGEPEWSLHFWCQGFVEVYNLRDDPNQLFNVLDPSASHSRNSFGKELMQHWMPVINGMGSCVGSRCSDPLKVAQTVNLSNLSSLLPCETWIDGGGGSE